MTTSGLQRAPRGLWFLERRQRLEAFAAELGTELRLRQDQLGLQPDGDPLADRSERRCGAHEANLYRLAAATKDLQDAGTFMSWRRSEAAWTMLLDARRHLVPLLPDDEREALALSLKSQLPKVSARRARAMSDLLTLSTGAAHVMEALRNFDEDQSNHHRRLRARRFELSVLGIVLASAVAVVTAMLVSPEVWGALTANDGDLPSEIVLPAALFGTIGACISGIERTATRPENRVPNERAAGVLTVLRPITGAATGLVVVAAAIGGRVSSGLTVLIGAFASGFSERYVLRFTDESDGDDARRSTNPTRT